MLWLAIFPATERHLELFEPRPIDQYVRRERLPLRRLRNTDEARMPVAKGVGVHAFYDPVRRRRATVNARLEVAVTLSYFDRAFCHRCSLHRSPRWSEARGARQDPHLLIPWRDDCAMIGVTGLLHAAMENA